MTIQPSIVIPGTGITNAVSKWLCAASLAGLLLIAVVYAHRSGGTSLLAAGLGVFFGSMLIYAASLRVELTGDEISYQHLFRRRRSLRLDQIRSARGTWRSSRGGKGFASYIVVEPMDAASPFMKIRMDFFSHADVQTIRNFFGDKLKRHGKIGRGHR